MDSRWVVSGQAPCRGASIGAGRLALLQRLLIDASGLCRPQLDYHPVLSVAKLEACRIAFRLKLRVFDIPWSQLSIIDICAGSLSRGFLPALDNAQSLEHLLIQCDRAAGLSEAARNGYPLLGSLRFLSTDSTKLLSLLRLPVLQKLVCKDATRRTLEESPCKFPRTMLQVMKSGRSDFLSLKTLHIFDGEKTSKSILAVMKVVSNLEELEIHVRGQMRVTYFEPLIPPLASQPFILPKLRLLSFIEDYYGDARVLMFTPTKSVELLDMVQMRRPTLESLTIVLDDPFHFPLDLLLRLHALKSDGFSWTQEVPVDSDSDASTSDSDVSTSDSDESSQSLDDGCLRV
ncbi:hypothetical protein BDZ89DRAFT_594197 [Hymenopellis radicata]|nr:hypothetical protein BDZ89DRAFT_594197 [Hymenopellis radicata]